MSMNDTAQRRIPYPPAAWTIAAIALALRLLHVHFTQRFNPLAGDLQLDAATYDRWARALSLGVAAAVAPLTARNALRTGEFIPLTAGAGINFYHGNNPGANGFYQVPVYRGVSLGGTPEEQSVNMERVASKERGRALSPAEVSDFWLRAGLEYARGNPGAWASLLWSKFQFFWNAYERANVESFHFHRRFAGILSLPLLTFGIVAPLGLLGVFLTRGRWKKLWLLYGGILAYLAVALAFYVLARYRLPVVVFLIPFAGAACVELAALVRGRRAAELVLSLAALGAIAFFTNMTVARDTPGGVSHYHVRSGDAYVARGDTTRAETEYRRALELDGGNEAAARALEGLRRGAGAGRPRGQMLR
jgi:hypothetical protein